MGFFNRSRNEKSIEHGGGLVGLLDKLMLDEANLQWKVCAKCSKKVIHATKKCPYCGSMDFRKVTMEDISEKLNREHEKIEKIKRIEIYVENVVKPSSREEYIGPKGITDVIGGMYGNTAVRMERKVKFTPAKTKWEKDTSILRENDFYRLSNSQHFSYKDVSSVRVYRESNKNDKKMGHQVSINLKTYPHTLSFRTLKANEVERFIYRKIEDDATSNILETTGMPSAMYDISIRYMIDNPNKIEITKPPQTNNKNEEKSFSVADELMKFGELYK